MNMNLDESSKLISDLKEISIKNVDVKIAPSFTNLYHSNSMLNSSKIEVIAQDLHFEKNGAYTGEVSAKMLLGIGINTSIIGHSERRKYFNESNQILSKKVTSAIQHSMQVIFCVGEELSERENNNYFNKFPEFRGKNFKDIRGACSLKIDEIIDINKYKKETITSLYLKRLLNIISWKFRFITRLFKKK